MKMNINIRQFLFLVLCVPSILFQVSCSDILDKHPTDKLTEATFWQTEKDALLALTGVYHEGTQANGRYFPFWMKGTIMRFDLFADNGNEKDD